MDTLDTCAPRTSGGEALLLRTIAYVLRHGPSEFFLKMDGAGWVNLQHMIAALRVERPEWSSICEAEVRALAGKERRFEIVGDRIRALYGHSLTGIHTAEATFPPPILYHGTCRNSLRAIQIDGLQPMSRRHVHLTTKLQYAMNVAARAARSPVVVRVLAKSASMNGIMFWKANDHVWLSKGIPPKHIEWNHETHSADLNANGRCE